MDVLIDADTLRSPAMRHEIPAGIVDPFLYGEADGVPFAVTSKLDAATIERARPGLRQLDLFDLGVGEAVAAGVPAEEALLAARLRACRELCVTEAVVPPDFPVATADHLRAHGIALRVDRETFTARRRVKPAWALEGVRRATRAAELGLAAARAAIAPGVTCEEVRALVRAAVEPHAVLGEFTVAHGPQTAEGHSPGGGPIRPGEPVIVDLAPQDRETAMFTDIARTFVAGEPDPEIARWHTLVLEVLEDTLAHIAPGVAGADLHARACDRFEAEGFPTQRKPGKTVMDGFPTSLGHGVGLEIHEAPSLGRSGGALVAGDVVTVEPYLCRTGFGGVQVEEILVVTETGAELLSHHPRGL